MIRAIAIILGIVLAAFGGVIAYRALFLEPTAAVVISSSGNIRELPNYTRIVGGCILFLFGAGMAFVIATRKRM